MKKVLASSETIREIVLNENITNFDFRQYIEKGTPQHKPKPDVKFLQWFIGFVEAEGCFQRWKDKKKDWRFGLEITQKDPALMYKIRTQLGFGKARSFTKANGEVYGRFTILNQIGLEALILLVNGNLVTEKKQNQFLSWLQYFNERYNTAYVERGSGAVGLNNAWLSGFLEGDGGFDVSPPKHLVKATGSESYISFIMKFYLTQKGEKTLLEKIALLFQIAAPIRTLTYGSTTMYNRLETTNPTSLLLVLAYLKKYPFLGQRAIQLSRCSRVLPYLQNVYPSLTPKAFLKLQRLIQATKAPGKKKDQWKLKKI